MRAVRPLFTTTVGLALLFAGVQEGRGEFLNIDIGRNWGAPTDVFGGPSGQAGRWNNINALGTWADLVDLTGVPTDVDLILTADFEGSDAGVPTTDAELLVKDMYFSLPGNRGCPESR